MLRFHLDENVDHAVAVGLRNRGIDATTTDSIGIKGATALALRETRVIVTHDDDLLVLHSQGIPHAGIVFSRLRTRSIGQMILRLASLSRRYHPSDLMRHVEYI
jgi:predicted nuclease of predicted toxin-antitoxin system